MGQVATSMFRSSAARGRRIGLHETPRPPLTSSSPGLTREPPLLQLPATQTLLSAMAAFDPLQTLADCRPAKSEAGQSIKLAYSPQTNLIINPLTGCRL